jgi:hypothetical protein
MRNQAKLKDIGTEEYLEEIETALAQLKKRSIHEKKSDPVKNQKAWDNLMSLSE